MSRTNVGLEAIYDGGLAKGFTVTAAGAGRHRRHRGGSLLSKGLEFARKHKLASRALTAASAAGYGRRRRSSGGRRRRHRASGGRRRRM